MSDELVKRANEAVAALAVYGSDDDQKVADLLLNLRVRIEALTAERDALKQIAADHVLQELEQAARADKAEAELAKAVEALRDLTNAFAKKVDVDQTRWKMPYEHPLSAYDRAVAFLKGDKP